jgi:hypothetical protein
MAQQLLCSPKYREYKRDVCHIYALAMISDRFIYVFILARVVHHAKLKWFEEQYP